jgi:hypothetical protein
MITFLASPKAFEGIAKVHQYRAIQSWLAAGDDVEVILYGDAAGIDVAGAELGVRVVKRVDCASSGIPYFGAIAGHAAEHARHDLQIYLNCDILLAGPQLAMQQIVLERFLMIGQRIDLAEDVFVDLRRDDWLSELGRLSDEGNATLHSPSGIDYFGFRRGLWEGLPPVVIGRGGYDNAIMAHCMWNRIAIVDATYAVAALHQFHDYGHMSGGVTAVMRGADALANIGHAGGAHSALLVSDARYALKDACLTRRPCRGDRLRAVELKLRYEHGLTRTALALRLLWRALASVGAVGVPQLQFGEVLASYHALSRPTVSRES